MNTYYLHSRLCLLTALIYCLTVLLEYLDLFRTKWQGTANIWEGLGPARRTFWLDHYLKLLYLVFHTFQPFYFPIILALCLYTAYNSGIILAKIVTYYSAGILGASLEFMHMITYSIGILGSFLSLILQWW